MEGGKHSLTFPTGVQSAASALPLCSTMAEMELEREQSISPMTRSPRSLSPNVRPLFNADPQARLASPLRMEHKANGSAVPFTPHARESVQPTTSGSIKFQLPAEAESFPFHAAPGAAGEIPTNKLVAAAPAQSPQEAADQATRLAEPSDGQLSRKHTHELGNLTPTGRRSVQFARSGPSDASASILAQSAHQSMDSEQNEEETPIKERQGLSLMSKLKALATPVTLQGHGRSLSGWTIGDSTVDEAMTPGATSPAFERTEPRYLDSRDEGSEVDADAEESGPEGTTAGPSNPRKRRKSRRLPEDGTQTAPTTPKTSRLPPFLRDSPSITPTSTNRPTYVPRRATMQEIPEHQRQGVSEDEGRDRLAKDSVWRRGNAWVHNARGLSYNINRRHGSQETPDGKRPGNLRRLTGFGGTPAPDGSPSPWRQRGERTSSISAQKWRQLKAGLKMLGQKRKEENKIDRAKSAALMAELFAGAPAALFLASMFQRDEHGNKRIPILLEQLKVRIADSQRIENKSGDRHVLFRIELEYGSGLTRMKWVIQRTLRDFANLHIKYKLQNQSDKYRLKEHSSRARLPRFPRSAFPYLRGVRGLIDDDDDDEEEEGTGADASGPDANASGTDRPGKPKRRGSSFAFIRRRSSISSPHPSGATLDGTGRAGSITGLGPGHRETYVERQRRRLEQYLQSMITYLIFRPDSNRLCKFLELSALGVRLAAEGGYHGKEGFMVIQSAKGLDFRKAWRPKLLKNRHQPKWFLVRHSYVVCVDSPEEMNVYDVFLVDNNFGIEPRKRRLRDDNMNAQELANKAKDTAAAPKHHVLRIRNAERRMKLLAKSERQLHQFEESISFMASSTVWAKLHRFESFAPIRQNVWAQWLVDGRDYMWNVSRAISMARDVIYIHDWWLSPELYMRRPAAISQKWRLDRLLQRKAQEGVKIFVILYRNIESAIPIDSEYTKFSLLDLHPNVFVQRSPNQFRQNTFFWAHHEKICVVDHTVAFCGGVDLCFGRWDTPEHTVTDDKLTGFEVNDLPKDADHCQLWPGKDYSNPRVQDFYALDKPYDEMYDRSKVPRMPWHDIGMQIVGQPARDLSRHFVQRWNYILRQRKPSRPTPFLLPPPDFNTAELEALGLDGTCEIQILRSACEWSLGTQGKTEHSIMNAYIKMIETSDHFVYIENQFFISSCEVEGTKIENLIGDALVERIVRAAANDEEWRVVIVIPLMPGFQNTVDSADGSSIRLIMQCQYRSICRGDSSIFGRLRAAGIEPEDYIQFYALRQWGKIGPKQALVTEQLYIHAKCMIVDDRVAIIGSANINERSMLGSRDSEVAAIVRDREMLPSYMAGEPYRVGRFPHTLRMRLMREHLGLDVDEVLEREREREQGEHDTERQQSDDDSSFASSPEPDRVTETNVTRFRHAAQDDLIARAEGLHSFNHDVDWEQETNPHIRANKKLTYDRRVTGNPVHEKDVRGEGPDHMLEHAIKAHDDRGRDSTLDPSGREVLVADIAPEGKDTLSSPKRAKRNRKDNAYPGRSRMGNTSLPPPQFPRMDTTALGLTQLSQLPALPVGDDTDIGGPPLQRTFSARSAEVLNPILADMRRPIVTQDCMRDPIHDDFFQDTWHTIAENNTRLYRLVFRCMPDNEVTDWKEYREYAAFAERFSQAQGAGKSKIRMEQETKGKTGPPGHGITGVGQMLGGRAAKVDPRGEGLGEKLMEKAASKGSTDSHGLGKVEEWAREQAARDHAIGRHSPHNEGLDEKEAMKAEDARTNTSTMTSEGESKKMQRERTVTISEPPAPVAPVKSGPSTKRRKRATTKSSTRAFHANDENAMLSKHDAEELLNLVQGHLVIWPYNWYVECVHLLFS